MFQTFFASWEANFVSATMFPEVDKQGKIGRKHNVSWFAQGFTSVPFYHIYLKIPLAIHNCTYAF